MRRIIYCVFCFLSFGIANAQDLLVTSGGDSLNCKITKEDDRYLYFSFTKDGIEKKTLIDREQVVSSQRMYFEQSALSTEKAERVKLMIYKPLKIGVAAGWGYRTAKFLNENQAQKDYLEGLRSGFQVSADIDYYFSNFIGVGLKYSVFRASTDGNIGGVHVEDKTTTSFIGPTFAMRFLSSSKQNAFVMNYSVGYLSYSDKGESNAVPAKLTAGTVGLIMDIGYEVGLSDKLGLLFQLSLSGGSFSSYNLKQGNYSQKIDIPDGGRENLGRMDLSVGIRFNP